MPKARAKVQCPIIAASLDPGLYGGYGSGFLLDFMGFILWDSNVFLFFSFLRVFFDIAGFEIRNVFFGG